MRVLMASSRASAREPGSPAPVTASILHSLAALARAGLATFTISVHDVGPAAVHQAAGCVEGWQSWHGLACG